MPVDLSRKLSRNFTLGELLASATAERDPALKALQHSPSPEVIASLEHLCRRTLEPLREELDFPIEITSGYRSNALNQKVGGAATSQHLLGQAADCRLSPRFLSDPSTRGVRRRIADAVEQRTQISLRDDVNANFYLFAQTALQLDALDIDQLIHEYGEGPGLPAWVHLSGSAQENRREILVIGPYARPEDRRPSLDAALRLGTSAAASVSLSGEGSMQQDPRNPARFSTRSGTAVRIEFEPIRTGYFVVPPPNVVEEAEGVYRFVASGDPGDIVRTVFALQFPEAHDPPGRYEVWVSGGDEMYIAPTQFEPPIGPFPATFDYVLSFVIAA